jgi:hypothetical protein
MTIPLPQRGQPIDTNYIYQLTEAINKVTEQVSPASKKYFSIDTYDAGKQGAKASEVRVVAGIKLNAVPTEYFTAGSTRPFSYPLGNDFKYTPVVTATPINISGSAAGDNVSLILTSVTTTSVNGIIRFNTNGEATIGINLIIMGIPN